MNDDLAVVSAADAAFFDLLQSLVRSIRDKRQGRSVPLYVFDIGLSEEQRRWLLVQGVRLRVPDPAPFGAVLPRPLAAFWARSMIPEIIPGHRIYLWMDADTWVQRWDAIELYVRGATAVGLAIAGEQDPAYDREFIKLAHRRSFKMFGIDVDEGEAQLPPVNAGIFAARSDAPHWQLWRELVRANAARASDEYLQFLLDQTALYVACVRHNLQLALLPSTCNWITHFALPACSIDGGELLRPLPPHQPVGIVHQAGATKREFMQLERTGGGRLSRSLNYEAPSQLAADEYVSPDLRVILPDRSFPELTRGDPAISDWPHLRRGIPHAWLVDCRIPDSGFLNRDEVHILYNLALQFCGRRALEIGCLMGWSACHMALAGVELDVVDPILGEAAILESVQTSLKASNPPLPVTLYAARSPAAVHDLAKTRPDGWSLFMIDGDHNGDAPLEDAKACLEYAAPDCAMLFHDVASPDVARAVLFLKEQGWRVRVYHTAQIMALAWRGQVEPVPHQPDPRVDWPIPDHLMPLLA